MDLTTIEKVVGGIQQSLFRNSNFYSVGMLKSHFKGFGLQFRDYQLYNHGDDVRFIDWKVLARTNIPYVKTFEEERNVEIIVLIDLSPSMFMGYKGLSKLQAAIEITSLLYMLAGKTKDRVTSIFVGDEITVLPNKNGKEGIVFLVSEMARLGVIDDDGSYNYSYRPTKDVSVRDKLVLIKKYLARNREVVILSDFISFVSAEELKQYIYRPSLHCFQISAPLDDADAIPFSLFGHGSGDINKRKIVIDHKSRTSKDEFEKTLESHFKKLSIRDRYLEEFVKEML